jgi:hypothetical protein
MMPIGDAPPRTASALQQIFAAQALQFLNGLSDILGSLASANE